MSEVEIAPEADAVAWLVAPSDGSNLPDRLDSHGFGIQKRLLDRFYLPENADAKVTRVLFDIVASIYNQLTNRGLNEQVAALLMSSVLKNSTGIPVILDFGCGTGIAFQVAPTLKKRFRLIGVDVSDAMLSIASAAGEDVLRSDEWRQHPPAVEGAFACFVMHYGIESHDLTALAESLRPGATFAANLFHMSEVRMAALEHTLSRLGLDAVRREPIGAPESGNLLALYKKRL